jgi:hypothetical protein
VCIKLAGFAAQQLHGALFGHPRRKLKGVIKQGWR